MSWKPLSVAFAVSTALLGTLVPATTASAAPAESAISTGKPRAALFVGPEKTEVFRAKASHGRGIIERIGKSRTGGVYRDASGEAVVAVTDDATAKQVSAEGGVPVRVARSTETLEAIKRAFDSTTALGVSWGIDPSENQVSVEYDSQVPEAEVSRLRSLAARYGSAVRLRAIGGRIHGTAFTSGGQGIQSGSTKCSLGFNVENPSSGKRYFLTAGHCVLGSHFAWDKAADGVRLGTVGQYAFPADDWALIPYANADVTAYGTVWEDGVQKQITRSAWPTDGDEVERVGTVSSDHVGQILVPSDTHNMEVNGTVYRMVGAIKTSLCSMNGDSGGPLYAGTAAIGLTSGSNMSVACSNGVSSERSWYQPVQPVLNRLGYRVY